MPRTARISDVFDAIAEPRRRQIVDLLAGGKERAVAELVGALRLRQPAVSKHLRVLRGVRLVSVTRRGRQRVYRLNPVKLKPIHDWISTYELLWSHQIHRIKQRAERSARELQQDQPKKEVKP